jgi:hypothetical protein
MAGIVLLTDPDFVLQMRDIVDCVNYIYDTQAFRMNHDFIDTSGPFAPQFYKRHPLPIYDTAAPTTQTGALDKI